MTKKNGILTTGQIAKYCQVDARTVHRWIDEGILKAYSLPITKFSRVTVDDFLQFLKEQKLPMPDEFKKANKINVLIVDDDLEMAKSIQRMLYVAQFGDFDCEIATSGFEAGKCLQKCKPELVILDLMMPNVNGFQVCKQIKSDPETRNIKVLAISGTIEGVKQKKIIEVGADDFLQKPFDEAALGKHISELLEKGSGHAAKR